MHKTISCCGIRPSGYIPTARIASNTMGLNAERDARWEDVRPETSLSWYEPEVCAIVIAHHPTVFCRN